jgi:methionyl-tRNA formyltransferase
VAHLATVFLGTSAFAADVLVRLASSERHRPALVVTRPDRPSGRGRRMTPPPVADTARELGLELTQPERVNEPQALARISAAGGEPAGTRHTVVVCAFGAIIREPLLSDHELVNVHPSLLPRWRGAAPVERAIMAGDARTGVSIMRLTEGLDSGPVCAQAPEPIAAEDTYGTLAPRLSAIAGDVLLRALTERPRYVEQPDNGVTYAEKITAADRILDPARPASELERTVRALHPHIGARAELGDGAMIGVEGARLYEGELGGDPVPGLHSLDGRLLLVARGGVLELLRVKPAGGRAMDAADYLRGRAGGRL